jgi:hypothetical protein
VWIRDHTPDAHAAGAAAPAGPPATATAPRTATLVYAVAGGQGRSRLWRWNLATDAEVRGPLVRAPTQLVAVGGAKGDRVGLTARLPNGRLEAQILTSLAPAARARKLVSGDLVSWDPLGAGVVAARRSGLGGCRHLITVDYRPTGPAQSVRQVDRTICGDIVSVGRDGALTYLTLRHDRPGGSRVGSWMRIDFAGLGRLHPVLRGFILAAVSEGSDLLVVHGDTPTGPGVSPFTWNGGLPVAEPGGVLAYYRGLGSRPSPYRLGGVRFRLDQLLSWSPDASVALVAGRSGTRVGLFELRMGPSDGVRTPVFVDRIDGTTFASYAADGSAYVADGGGVTRIVAGRRTPVSLPRGAPAPDGPIVWVP